MVAKNSGKIAKYTYAERVLHAFSQVRRKHRKHAVHMTSLRAQVRKNAEDQQDKLGPRWPNWVTKTVHRLEDEGILAPAHSSGSVVLTPTGQKAISSVRKSLAAATNTSPTSVNQELLWKAIAHQTPTKSGVAGAKRRRHSTIQPRNEDSEVLSSPARRVAKRARISLPNVKKNPSQRTKSGLQAAEDDVLMRPMSPLTDLDETEDREHLEEELRARDEEIRRVRNQLDELRSQTTPVRSSELELGQTRPEVTRGISPSPVVQWPTSGVVRTQSGSLICDVSKRPTPAPSSPSVDGGRTLEEDDVFRNSGESSTSAQRFGPVPPARQNAATEQEKRAREEMEHVYRNKISILEEALESRVREIQEQKQAREKLSEQIPRLEAQFADRVSTLEREIETLGASLSSASSDIISKDTELEHLRTSKGAVEISLERLEEENSRAKADLENARRELASTQNQITSISTLRVEAEATLTRRDEEAAEMTRRLQESLAERKSSEEQLSNEIYILELALHDSNALRDAKVTELSESIASSRQENEVLRDGISNLEVSVAELKDELAASASDYTLLKAAHQEKCDAYNVLSERAQEVERSAMQQAEVLMKTKAEMDRLMQNLEQSKASEDSWRKTLSQAEESHNKFAATLSAEVKRLQNLLDEAEVKAVISEGKSAELETVVQGLYAELANAQEKTRELEGALEIVQAEQTAEQKRYELTAVELKESLLTKQQQIDTARLDHRKVQEELVSHQKEFADATTALKEELAAAISRVNNTEQETTDLRRAKEMDEKTIETLKETFVQLRDAQLRSLSELGDKIQSTGSTPVSKKHLIQINL